MKKTPHSKPPPKDKLDTLVNEIISSPKRLSRWLAMMEGIRLSQSYEERWKLDEAEMNSIGLQKYIDEKAPRILEELNNLNRAAT